MRRLVLLLSSVLLSAPGFAQEGDCSAEACPTVLYLSAVELDASEDGWTVADGEVIQVDPTAGEATFSWSAPPKTITVGGFTIELKVKGTAAKDTMYAPIVYLNGPYILDPEVAQLPLHLDDGETGEETLSVHVAPWKKDLAAGTYMLDIGAAYGKAVHYAYTTAPPAN